MTGNNADVFCIPESPILGKRALDGVKEGYKERLILQYVPPRPNALRAALAFVTNVLKVKFLSQYK